MNKYNEVIDTTSQYLLSAIAASLTLRPDGEQIAILLAESDVSDEILKDFNDGMMIKAMKGGFSTEEVANAIISTFKSVYGE